MKCCCDDLKRLLTEIRDNGVGGGGGAAIDYTPLINNILTELDSIEIAINGLPDNSAVLALIQGILTSMSTTLSIISTNTSNTVNELVVSNTYLASINVAITAAYNELVAINAALLLLNREATQQLVLTTLTELYNNAPAAGTHLQSTSATAINTIGGGLIPSSAASARSVSIRTSADFIGTIDGITFPADDVISYSASEHRVLTQIAYTLTAGSIYIRTVNV